MAWTEQLPSGKYRGGYRLPTGQKRSAGTFSHKKAALVAASAAEEKASLPGWKDPKAGARKWGEWVKDWWGTRTVSEATLRSELSMRNRIDERWSQTSLASIERDDILRWAISLMKEESMQATSVNRHLAIFKASLNSAVAKGILDSNPANKLSLAVGETDRRRYLTQAEAQSVMNQMPRALDKAFTALLFGCGLRFGEAAGFQVNRLGPKFDYLRTVETWVVRTGKLAPYTKAKRIRTVPVPDWVANKIIPFAEGRKSGFLFLQKDGLPMNYNLYRKRLARAATRAGVEVITVHDTRHTYASWLLQNGVSLAEVGRLLGHIDSKTTEIYAHLAPQKSQHILEALPELE